jgi:hypothetical protein
MICIRSMKKTLKICTTGRDLFHSREMRMNWFLIISKNKKENKILEKAKMFIFFKIMMMSTIKWPIITLLKKCYLICQRNFMDFQQICKNGRIEELPNSQLKTKQWPNQQKWAKSIFFQFKKQIRLLNLQTFFK